MDASPLQAASVLSALVAPEAAQAWAASVFLLSLRVSATLLMTPVLHAMPAPPSVRMLLAIGLAVALASGFAVPPGTWSGWSAFLSSAVFEFALGATLGLGILLAFGAFAVAGQLLDVQIGFLPFLLIDLIVSSILMALGMMMMPPTTIALPLKVLMFILVDGWSLVLKALVGSFHRGSHRMSESASREQMISEHLPFARMLAATPFGRRTHDDVEFGDYLQFARIGPIEAVDRFDPGRGAHFKTFAAKRIRGAMRNGLVRFTEKNQQIGIDRLGARQRAVIRFHYLQEIPFDEVAAIMGVTRGRISQLHREGLRQLREFLHDDARCDVLL